MFMLRQVEIVRLKRRVRVALSEGLRVKRLKWAAGSVLERKGSCATRMDHWTMDFWRKNNKQQVLIDFHSWEGFQMIDVDSSLILTTKSILDPQSSKF